MQLPGSLTRAFGQSSLVMKKNSPHIFFGAGVAGLAASTILACRATLKLEKTLDEVKERIEKAKVAEHISEEDRPKVVAAVYFKGAMKVGALYAPTVILAGASVALLTSSHVQLTRRNSALSGALAVMSQAFEEYRERVREEVGEEKEQEIFHGIREEERKIDGKKQLVKVVDPNHRSVYARCFDSTSHRWENNPELNKIFLQHQQNYLNHMLHSRGYLFLNEVYEALGFEHTAAGQIVGWLAKTEHGDGYVDFRIFEPENARFVNGYENCIWLDFNVDGSIYAQIDNLGRVR